MNSSCKRATSAPVAVIVLVVTLGLLPAVGQAGIELVAVIPPTGGISPEYVDGIEVLDDDPNEVVFVTRNQGAGCGGGTAVSAWKMTLDPVTGQALTLALKQHLSQIQNIRGAFLESTVGTLFTGGGWCGPKPPYVSVDGGETYRPATIGVHPPNSTFSYVEFQGDVYAGTGYSPWPAQVYRWIGSGPNDWELVLHLSPPRTVVGTMAEYQGQLFVGTHFISCGGCAGTTAVYVSPDGNTFNPTLGIPSCHAVVDLLAVGDELVARTALCGSVADHFIYQWNGSTSTWAQTALIDFGLHPRLVEHEGVIFAYGHAPSDAEAGIYRSEDLGQSWEQIEVFAQLDVTTLHMHEGTLYLGTRCDASNNAYIYRLLVGEAEARLDIKPGSCPNSFNRRSHGVLPVALLGSNAFDVSQVDLSSVTISRADGVGGAVGPNEGPPGPHSEMEDVGTPFEGELCECHEATGDGWIDLSMKFLSTSVVEVLELDALPAGDLVELIVSGDLLDGTTFEASDCVRLVPPGSPPGALRVDAGAVNRWVAMSPLDLQLDGGGFGAFQRTYPLTTTVTITAPDSVVGGEVFLHWVIDGVRQSASLRTLNLTIVEETHQATAVYGVREIDGWQPRRQGFGTQH